MLRHFRFRLTAQLFVSENQMNLMNKYMKVTMISPSLQRELDARHLA